MLSTGRPSETNGAKQAANCRLCSAALRDTLVDLGSSPPCESFLERGTARRDGAVLSAPRLDLRRVPARPARGVRAAEEIFSDYAYFSAYSELVGRACPALRRAMIAESSASARTASSSSWRRTTATCCSTSSQRGIPSLGIDPAANVADGGRASAAWRRSSTFFDSAARAPSWRSTAAGADSIVANNVLAQVPDAQRLRRRHRDRARRRRRRDDRGAAPRPADRRAPVRHDLPRALLVLLADDARAAVRRATGSRCSTSRSCRLTAARSAST